MKKLFIIFLLGAGLTPGCNKILTQNPLNDLNSTTAFTTGPSITAGLLGAYNALQNASYYGTDFTLFADLEAGNTVHTGSFPQYTQVSERNITPDNTTIDFDWNQIYAGIGRVNTIIGSAAQINSPGFDTAGALGEAKFLRAFMYFDLMRLWGGTPSGFSNPNGEGVPLVLTPTYTAADAAPHARSTAGEVFTQILSDLTYAVANLPATNNFGQATQNAAIALRARVELYIQQYDAAAADAETIISQLSSLTPNGGLSASYASNYIVKNQQPESIFELQFDATNANGLYFYYYGRDEVATAPGLKAAYDTINDQRYPVNYYPLAGVIGTAKYDLADGSNDVTLIRLAEVYLIHAESVLLGSAPNIAAAQSDVNVVRNRAGLANTTALTVPALQAEILLENRLEFPAEAHYWFDLRREGLCVSTFQMADSTKVLWPIPQTEVLTSNNVIAQNPGY